LGPLPLKSAWIAVFALACILEKMKHTFSFSVKMKEFTRIVGLFARRGFED